MEVPELLRPCRANHNPGSSRMNFQWNCLLRAQGPVLNVGCSDDPLRFEDRCTHFDIDDWSAHFDARGQMFIQGDAHQLTRYFGLDAFDTVILGDIVEHLVDPHTALMEAARVTSRALCFTVWMEQRLPGVGRHIEAALELAAKEVLKHGYDDYQEMQRVEHPDRVGFPEDEVPHLLHIWQFSDAMIQDLVNKLAEENLMDVASFVKAAEVIHEGDQFYNYLVLL